MTTTRRDPATYTDEGPRPEWMLAERATMDTSATAPHYVVRTKRGGKFVRAMGHEYAAWRWCHNNPAWTYALETPHAPDADGRIFDPVRK